MPGETAVSCSVRALNSRCATAAAPLTRRARRQVAFALSASLSCCGAKDCSARSVCRHKWRLALSSAKGERKTATRHQKNQFTKKTFLFLKKGNFTSAIRNFTLPFAIFAVWCFSVWIFGVDEKVQKKDSTINSRKTPLPSEGRQFLPRGE